MLLEAIETVRAGGRPLMCLDETAARALRGPDTVDGVGPGDAWEAYWLGLAERRRRNAPWLAREQSAA